MNFQTAVETCFRKYINFEGRASRSEYWWFWLFTFIVIGLLGTMSNTLAGIAWLAFFFPSIAVLVRRLHDTETSGWWALLLIIPLIGFLILLYFLIMPGTLGANKYGDKPI